MATLTGGSSVTIGMDAWATLSLVVTGSATLAFTSGAENVHPSFEVTKATSRDFGPYGCPMSVVVTAVDRSLTYTITGGVGGFAFDSSGNVTGLVGPGGYPLSIDAYAARAPYGLTLLEPPVSVSTNAGANLTINSSAAATLNGEQVWLVNATATNTTNNYFEMNVALQSQAFAASDMTAEFQVDDLSKIDASGGGIVYYLGTASYSTFSTGTINNQLTPTNSSAVSINGMTAYHVREAMWTKSGFTDEVGNQAWVNCKIRVYVTNGQTLNFYLRSIRVGAFKKKARIAIVSDDGYDSWIKMGVPVLREYGFKSSCAVIYDALGTSDKTSLSALQRYVAEGNECIAHGPNDGTGGSGNLWTTYTTDTQRIADINACRDYLLRNGLTSQWGARCYIWPQGRFCTSTSDLSMLTLMQQNGYTVARTANTPTTHYMFKSNAVSSVNLAPLVVPMVGHVWASAGTETTNINSINARIAATAVARGDCTLMLHRVVGVDAAAASTEISTNRLRQILDAIKAEVDSGAMEVVLFSEFAK